MRRPAPTSSELLLSRAEYAALRDLAIAQGVVANRPQFLAAVYEVLASQGIHFEVGVDIHPHHYLAAARTVVGVQLKARDPWCDGCEGCDGEGGAHEPYIDGGPFEGERETYFH